MSHFPAGPWRGLSSCCLNGGLGQEVNLQRVPPRNLQARPSRPPHPAPSKLASLIKTAQPSPPWGEGSKKKPSPPPCENGRASWWGRVCQYVKYLGVTDTLKKKQ